jgi:hypothetical protein
MCRLFVNAVKMLCHFEDKLTHLHFSYALIHYSASPINVNAAQSIGFGYFSLVLNMACRKA